MSAFRNKKGVLQVPDDKSPSGDARNELAYTPKERVTDIVMLAEQATRKFLFQAGESSTVL